MPEIGTSGLMSGERKRGDAGKAQATAPFLDSTGHRPILLRRAVSAGLTAAFRAGVQNALEVDVRGSSGGTGRLDQGPWAAIEPAIEISALR